MRSRFEVVKGEGVEEEEVPSSSDAAHIQELLATTMKQIEERKKQTQALLVCDRKWVWSRVCPQYAG